MTMKNDTKLEEKLTCTLKIDIGIWQIFTRALKGLKKYVLMGYLWPKYIMLDLKKYGEVIFHGAEEWCKIWRKTDLWFEKWRKKFGKFSPEYLKVSKLRLWWDPFVQRRKCMSLKFTEELCVMAMKNNAKFEEELTCHYKTDMRNLAIGFNWLLLAKYIMC